MHNEPKSKDHHTGFGAGMVLGLLGGLFAYFLYDTPEGQDLKRRFKAELDQIKSNHSPLSSQPLPSVVSNTTSDQKPTGLLAKFGQLFNSSTDTPAKSNTKTKKAKKDASRRYFIRHHS